MPFDSTTIKEPRFVIPTEVTIGVICILLVVIVGSRIIDFFGTIAGIAVFSYATRQFTIRQYEKRVASLYETIRKLQEEIEYDEESRIASTIKHTSRT